ncbi:unnamed protein product [Kuraishia capsulata CBS 1993]|uniref:Uncharacterized protein n=1 Tax=Kuraishia capsulata CBS 1993 TaxID=1382522 RepID=W6MXS8_9ASCO|nr:unnamed protein product [Kuraishia capsulata CBS 1993]
MMATRSLSDDQVRDNKQRLGS